MIDFAELFARFLFHCKLTGIDHSPWIDPLYWYGRAPRIGYWALTITVTLSWLAALCWIIYVIRQSRKESLDEQREP